MVKFAAVSEGSVVQLGRFNKTLAPHSHKVGLVKSKHTFKVGKNVYTGVSVQIAPNEVIMVNLANIKSILN